MDKSLKRELFVIDEVFDGQSLEAYTTINGRRYSILDLDNIIIKYYNKSTPVKIINSRSIQYKKEKIFTYGIATTAYEINLERLKQFCHKNTLHFNISKNNIVLECIIENIYDITKNDKIYFKILKYYINV